MDPLFMTYSQVPQESKLATYMNRQNATPLINSSLSDALDMVSLDPTSALGKDSSLLLGSTVRRDLITPTRVNRSLMGRTNGESPSALSAITPPPVRESPGLMSDSPAQPIPTYRFQVNQENVRGTTYFYPTNAGSGDSPPAGFPSYTPGHNPTSTEETSAPGFFIPDNIRTELLERNALTMMQPDHSLFPDLPGVVDNYHELVPLEAPPMNDSMMIHSSTYKATHTKTGVRYCLRRIHEFRLTSTKCMVFVEMWKRLSHTNIVQLKEVFTTKAFGDHSIIFVYEYHPGCETLWTRHFSPTDSPGPLPFSADPTAPRPYSHTKNALLRHQHSSMLPENLLWNYIIQLTSAVRVIHTANLACRVLDPSKVVVSGKNRLRLSFLGITDVLTLDANAPSPLAVIPHFQQEDLTALGRLILALSCKSLLAIQRENVQTSLDLVGRTYSTDLKNLIVYLLSTQQRRSITEVMPMIGARFYAQLDSVQSYADQLENELSKEMENGRLFRLLSKLGIINERPELNMDPSWSETGDRYMLKLFRDYLFHQVTPEGQPWLDMSHVVHCLNKLDSGTQDKVCLMSRDEQSILVVTYGELKHCLEQSYADVVAATQPKNTGL